MNFIGVIENEVIGMGANTTWLLSFEKTEFIYGIDNTECVKMPVKLNVKIEVGLTNQRTSKIFSKPLEAGENPGTGCLTLPWKVTNAQILSQAMRQ